MAFRNIWVPILDVEIDFDAARQAKSHLMAMFITNIKFTQQGIKGIDETTKRAAAMKTSAKKIGVKITNVYWTLGDHDGVLIFEAPDDETATKLLLHLSSMGNVHTTTTRAFTAAEMDKILVKVHE